MFTSTVVETTGLIQLKYGYRGFESYSEQGCTNTIIREATDKLQNLI